MNGAPRLVRVRGVLPPGFDALRAEARAEGYRHMDRLAAEWASGANRFEQDDEALLVGDDGGALVGVGGVTHEPAAPDALRLRRFYVRPAYRGRGLGRAIAAALIETVPASTRLLTVNAGDDGAAAFWEALGFAAVRAATHTHAKLSHLDRAAGRAVAR